MFFKSNEYHLENAVKMNRLRPRNYLIPTQEEIKALKKGSLVKLIFVMKIPQDNGCRAERMWVVIEEINNRKFTGVLDNDPYYIKSIKCGDEIEFTVENIAGIYFDKEAPFDEKLFAIITKKALDNNQINWVIRTDDLNNEQDSGWQLFYGDENEEYLDDPNNASIVSLEDVLSFEPLLESVFSSSGHAYEYSAKLNKFIEVKG